VDIPELILIDVDGTLVDSVPDLAWSVDAAMRDLGLPERGEIAVRNWVGNGVEKLVHRALMNDLDKEADITDFESALEIFKKHYAQNTSKRSTLYPGVTEALEWFKAEKFNLGCVTNKAKAFTEPLLKDLGVYDFFSIVVSGDTLKVKKPDPGPLLHVSDFFNVAPAKSLMVGDSISDVKAARAAGFKMACMSYGYNHGEDISLASPDLVLDRMDELITLLK